MVASGSSVFRHTLFVSICLRYTNVFYFTGFSIHQLIDNITLTAIGVTRINQP